MTGLRIDRIGGNCPVEAEGFVDGFPFYFRARGSGWSFSVDENPSADPVEVAAGFAEGFDHWEKYSEDPYAAGWMNIEEAEAFIKKGAELYRAWKAER